MKHNESATTHLYEELQLWTVVLLYFNCTVLSQGVNNQSYSIAAQQRTKQKYVSLHIQSECGKIWTRITPNMGTFDAVDELSWGYSGMTFGIT